MTDRYTNPHSMTLDVVEKDGFCVLNMKGDISFEIIETMRDVLLARIDKNAPKHVIIDCEHLSFLDSGAVGFLVRLMKMTEAKNRKFALAGLKGQPEVVLRMVGFLEHVKLYSSYKSAKEYLNIQSGSSSSGAVIE